ncbi:MAG: hypothetical protein DWQ02_10710, partial [Bacteroidetes bacterium]
MKTVSTLFLFLLISCFSNVNAQGDYPYDFSHFQEEYADLENPVVLTDDYWDDFDELIYEFPLGFEFTFFDHIMTSIFLGDPFAEALYVQTGGLEEYNIMLPYTGDLISRYDNSGNIISQIGYLVEGEPGSRVLKGEFKNIGFYNDDDGTNFANFQFWLHESDGAIEFRYGPSNITLPLDYLFDDLPGPYVGLLNGYLYDGEEFGDMYMLSGDAADPTYAYYDGSTGEEPPALEGQPADGTVYRFGPVIINSVEETITNPVSIKVYPTITRNELN